MANGDYDWKKGLFGSVPSGSFGGYFDQRVTSHNQSGGITAHTVNLGPRDRTLKHPAAAGLKASLLELPKDRGWIIETQQGDVEAVRFAAEIEAFLLANGYEIWGSATSHIHPPVIGVRVSLTAPEPTPDKGIITVGHKPS